MLKSEQFEFWENMQELFLTDGWNGSQMTTSLIFLFFSVL